MQIKKTIAIQVDDPVFLEQYEKRQKESGLKVKDYLLGLIKADIQSHSITQTEAPGQDTLSDAPPEQSAAAQEVAEALPQTAETTPEEQRSLAESDAPEQQQDQSLAESDTPEAGQEEAAPVYSGEISNLFVKVTKEQRAAIDARKAETGETTNSLLNRLIGDFLEDIRGGSTPDGFYETYDHFGSIAKSCDTTCSAKIPAEMNRELAEYLENTGRSRNVLMATLVHIDLHSQEMSEEQGQGMTM